MMYETKYQLIEVYPPSPFRLVTELQIKKDTLPYQVDILLSMRYKDKNPINIILDPAAFGEYWKNPYPITEEIEMLWERVTEVVRDDVDPTASLGAMYYRNRYSYEALSMSVMNDKSLLVDCLIRGLGARGKMGLIDPEYLQTEMLLCDLEEGT